MALVSCPNCGKSVSDKAAICPGCGFNLLQASSFSQGTHQHIVCKECGVENEDNATLCVNCGYPLGFTEQPPQKVEVTNVSLPKIKQKSKKILVGISLVAILLVVATLVFVQIRKQNAIATAERISEEYGRNLSTAIYTMLTGGATAEEAGNLIKNVWYNTIYEESDETTDKYTRKNNGTGSYYDDFNDSLAVLFSDSSFDDSVSRIEENQEQVATLVKSMASPPEEYEDAYTSLKEYYDAYLRLTNLVTNPTGSLQTFSSNFNEADTSFANCYSKMKIYVD